MTGENPPRKAPRPGPHAFKNRPPALAPTSGSPTTATPAQSQPQPTRPVQPQSAARPDRPQGRPQAADAHSRQVPGHEFFVNPYNFVPLHTSRDATQDGPPEPQGVWHEGLLSGHITLCLVTKTPLLAVRRTREATTEKPALLTVRTAPDGTPAINGSSIKGMLRSQFEQATGSRLGIFSHDERLSYRRSAEGAQGLKLAKVVRSGGDLELLVFEGLKPPRGRNPAPVWVEHAHVARIPFGTQVFMRLRVFEKDRRKAWFPATLSGSRARADGRDHLTAPPGWYDAGFGALLVRARLHNTGHTITGKRFERVFVEEVLESDDFIPDLGELLVTRTRRASGDQWLALRANWRAQIESMSGEAGTDSSGNKLALAPYGNKDTRAPWKKLNPGQTLFVETEGATITGMYPGMITREMRDHTPRDLVPQRFLPADSASELSPADRVFGWVASKSVKGRAAYRGLLAVGGVRCLTAEPIARFPAVRLATLATPKESQFRFYTRERSHDPKEPPAALDDVAISDGFNPQKHVIAGHKVYPHHGMPDDWWRTPARAWNPSNEVDDGAAHPTAPNHQPLSYLAPSGTKKQISAELDSWIKPGVRFETRLRVTNLREDELGALLWILDRDGHHRLGLGKPLGFGSLSVSIDWEATAIRDQNQLIDRYRGVAEGGVLSRGALSALRDKFEKHFRDTQPVAYRAMLESAQGFSGRNPVHYPWVQPARPQAESFHWFVTNERGEREEDQKWPRHALPLLKQGQDPKLPVLRKRKGQGS